MEANKILYYSFLFIMVTVAVQSQTTEVKATDISSFNEVSTRTSTKSTAEQEKIPTKEPNAFDVTTSTVKIENKNSTGEHSSVVEIAENPTMGLIVTRNPNLKVMDIPSRDSIDTISIIKRSSDPLADILPIPDLYSENKTEKNLDKTSLESVSTSTAQLISTSTKQNSESTAQTPLPDVEVTTEQLLLSFSINKEENKNEVLNQTLKGTNQSNAEDDQISKLTPASSFKGSFIDISTFIPVVPVHQKIFRRALVQETKEMGNLAELVDCVVPKDQKIETPLLSTVETLLTSTVDTPLASIVEKPLTSTEIVTKREVENVLNSDNFTDKLEKDINNVITAASEPNKSTVTEYITLPIFSENPHKYLLNSTTFPKLLMSNLTSVPDTIKSDEKSAKSLLLSVT